MALTSGTKLGPYEILSPAGAGGMGEVYRARDTRLDRTVAIKVLPSHLSDKPELRQRLGREARSVSNLSHPNICTLYDIGEQDGTDYLVLEFLEGETLEQRLQRGPLPAEQVVRLAVEITDALDAAHAKGTIHRDIKPSNIFITQGGLAKVLDFGLAKLKTSSPATALTPQPESPTVSKDATDLTTPGTTMGTIAYMSPEQARSEELDARSDLFSFGAVLYEMATGQRPFRGKTSLQVAGAILHSAPEPPAKVNPAIPVELERIIFSALEKDRDVRCQSASELRAELRRLKREMESTRTVAGTAVTLIGSHRGLHRWLKLAAALVFVAVAGLGAWYGVSRWRQESMDSVAVLPFFNGSGDPNTEYLSDGITESLTDSLAQIPNLRVASSASAFHYKGKDIRPRDVARDLDVHTLLTGRVVREGDMLSISAALVDAEHDRQMWGKQYRRKMSDVLALQSDIVRDISQNLRLRMSSEQETRMARPPTDNPAAYELYLKGLYNSKRFTREGLLKGSEYLQQAIALDPNYVQAYNGLVYNYSVAEDWIFPPREVMPQAKEAAKTAVQLDPSSGAAHANLAYILFFYDYDPPAAENEFKLALKLSPNDSYTHEMYGWFLVSMKRFDEGIAEGRRGQELDPLSSEANMIYGMDLYYARRYDQAVKQLKTTIDLAPDFWVSYDLLGWSYEAQGKLGEAVQEYQKARRLEGHIAEPLASLGRAYALQGKKVEAQQVLDELREFSKHDYLPPYNVALVYSAMGDRDKAVAEMEKAYQARSWYLDQLAVDPKLDDLRPDPRFQALEKQVGLP